MEKKSGFISPYTGIRHVDLERDRKNYGFNTSLRDSTESIMHLRHKHLASGCIKEHDCTWYSHIFFSPFTRFQMTKSTATVATKDDVAINTLCGSKESPDQYANKVADETSHTQFDKIRLVILILGIILAQFVTSLNSTVVAPALTIIAAELDALENQTWIATAYFLGTLMTRQQ